MTSAPPLAGTAKLMLVGIDGLRLDRALGTGLAPNIDALAASGHVIRSEVEGPTISGPSWATILTGATHAEHGIDDNDMHAHRLAGHPDFLTRAWQQDPRTVTYAAAGWPNLTDPEGLGPIVRQRPEQIADGRHALLSLDGEGVGYRVIDPEIAAHARATLADLAPDVSFVYFCETDDAGHDYGVLTPQYDEAVTNSDRHLGYLLDAVDARVAAHGETWIVAVTTDHGHVDTGGHGGFSPEETQTFLIVSARGGSLPAGLPDRLAPREFADWLLELRAGL